MEHNGHDKLNGILRGFLGDSFTLNGKEGGLNMSKMLEFIKKEKPKMNVLLMGGTGVGKSSLINALFGEEIAEAGLEYPNDCRFHTHSSRSRRGVCPRN
ncbi:hypothetical protein HMPREF1428_00805 [Helicobacter pylori GAM83T]|nr:hypothetical protein HMPREF1428_00805 [Helicobacter pylori GAM83T]